MPETNTPTIPADVQRTLTDLKADILDAADDALLDAYTAGRDAGLTEQQAKLDTVVAERARTTNHLYGLLQSKDAELMQARDLAAATWDLATLRIRVAELEHQLRVSQSNHATDRERLDTEIRNHQKTRAALAAARENPPARPGVGIGGERPPNRAGEVVYVFGTSAEGGGYSRIVGDTPANLRRIYNLRASDTAAVEFPAGHIVWAASPWALGEIRRLFHSK